MHTLKLQLCLQAEKDLTVNVTNWTKNENQQWLLGAPQYETQNTNEENQTILAQHHQFVEDKAVARSNQLEEELKRYIVVTCSYVKIYNPFAKRI